MEKSSYAPVPLRVVMGIIFSMAGYTKLVGIPGTIEYFASSDFLFQSLPPGLLPGFSTWLWNVCLEEER
jgi:uncharacterized membrane protein YphA (DoxX/SURF4 family)